MYSVEASRRITNFKPIRLDFGPFVGLERFKNKGNYGTSHGTGINIEDLEDYLNSVEFLNILRYYMQSDGFKDDFRNQIDLFLNFDRTYYLLKKEDVFASLENLTQSDTIIPYIDRVELLKQKEYYGFGKPLSKDDYKKLPKNFSLFDHLTIEEIEKLLWKQSTFYNRIPNFNDLESNNVIKQIFQLIDDRKYLSEKDVFALINKTFTERLTQQIFITYDQIVDIMDSPLDIINILSQEEYIELLKRHAAKLQIIKEEDILKLSDLSTIPIIYPKYTEADILSIIQKEQEVIKLSKDCLLPSDILSIIEKYNNNGNTTNCCKEEELFDLTIQKWIQQTVSSN